MSSGRTAGIYDFDNIRSNIERIRKEENVINPGNINNTGSVSSNGVDTTNQPSVTNPTPDYVSYY